MRLIPLMTACVLLLAGSAPALAAPGSPAGSARVPELSAFELVQERAKKDARLKQKVKRVWRNLTGYEAFSVCRNCHRSITFVIHCAEAAFNSARGPIGNADRFVHVFSNLVSWAESAMTSAPVSWRPSYAPNTFS